MIMDRNTEIPVYLFTGFLESGKTKFIQEMMTDDRFNEGEKTLLLVFEEGEEEYQPKYFASPNVRIEYVEDIDDINDEVLETIAEKKVIRCSEAVIFNRFDNSKDKAEFHKIVRTAGRKIEILYEYADGHVEPDNIPDPLPFDLNADIVEIKEEGNASQGRRLRGVL